MQNLDFGGGDSDDSIDDWMPTVVAAASPSIPGEGGHSVEGVGESDSASAKEQTPPPVNMSPSTSTILPSNVSTNQKQEGFQEETSSMQPPVAPPPGLSTDQPRQQHTQAVRFEQDFSISAHGREGQITNHQAEAEQVWQEEDARCSTPSSSSSLDDWMPIVPTHQIQSKGNTQQDIAIAQQSALVPSAVDADSSTIQVTAGTDLDGSRKSRRRASKDKDPSAVGNGGLDFLKSISARDPLEVGSSNERFGQDKLKAINWGGVMDGTMLAHTLLRSSSRDHIGRTRLAAEQLMDARCMYVVSSPFQRFFAVSSVLPPYQDNSDATDAPKKKGGRRSRRMANHWQVSGSIWEDDYDDSSSDSFSTDDELEYDPEVLEADIRAGKQRTELRKPGYISSVLPFVTARQLKSEINELFRSQHPELPQTLTLTKIRACKSAMYAAAMEVGLEIFTLGVAVIYFERLILLGLVVKSNRKLIAATCLWLAAKVYEDDLLTRQAELQRINATAKEKFDDDSSHNANTQIQSYQTQLSSSQSATNLKTLEDLMDAIESKISCKPSEVIATEIGVMVSLGFRLFPRPDDVIFHMKRFLKDHGMSLSDYLGDGSYSAWLHALQADKINALQVDISSPPLSAKHTPVESSSGSAPALHHGHL